MCFLPVDGVRQSNQPGHGGCGGEVFQRTSFRSGQVTLSPEIGFLSPWSPRSVNYLDLSKLGNEGETPNSDEIWVTVEDDNKFLTSDTETYSVATDKVSTMATFKGHVGSQMLDNSGMLRR